VPFTAFSKILSLRCNSQNTKELILISQDSRELVVCDVSNLRKSLLDGNYVSLKDSNLFQKIPCNFEDEDPSRIATVAGLVGWFKAPQKSDIPTLILMVIKEGKKIGINSEVPLPFKLRMSEISKWDFKPALKIYSSASSQFLAVAFYLSSITGGLEQNNNTQTLHMGYFRWNQSTLCLTTICKSSVGLDDLNLACIKALPRQRTFPDFGGSDQLFIHRKYKRVFVIFKPLIQQLAYLVYCQHGNEFLPIGGGHRSYPGLYLQGPAAGEWTSVDSISWCQPHFMKLLSSPPITSTINKLRIVF
jgi:hypothetical protein